MNDRDSLFRERQLALFRASVLKRAKWNEIRRMLRGLKPAAALDLGSDNGVISYLLRQLGGRWTSADLTPMNVAAISRMTGERAVRLGSETLPFADASFDLIVIVDMLEHVQDDALLMREASRCLRPGGTLVAVLPVDRRSTVLSRFRHAIGLTDAWHGHLRPGYDPRTLSAISPPELAASEVRYFSRFFSQVVDTALNAVYLHSAGQRSGERAEKGMVVTGDDLGAGSLGLMRAAYPVLRLLSAMDALLPRSGGYMMVARLQKEPASTAS